jgi:D-alanine-D-alanine ligase
VLHGTYGEDGTMQGFFEILNTAYVGAPVMGSSMAMDKVIAKQIWGAYGLPVAPYTSFFIHEWKQNPQQYMEAIMKYLHLPCFVKPANLGSSVGISKVKTESELAKAIDLAFTFDRKIIVEKGLHVRELECAVLGNENAKPSRVGEILVGGEFYDYNDKYINGVSKTQIPADISSKTEKEAQNIALQAFHALNLRGLARVDIFMEMETNKLYLNEINTMPGFTSISMYPKLWMNMGLTFEELIDSLIMYAFEEFNAKQNINTTFTSQSDWYKQ